MFYFAQIQRDEYQLGNWILNDVSLDFNGTSDLFPWFLSVGDVIALYPIVYADRVLLADDREAFVEADDRYIVEQTVLKYIYDYPFFLDDGTISRPLSWADEGFIEVHGHVRTTFVLMLI